LGFQPTSPTELPLTWFPQGTFHQQKEQLSTQRFLQQIAQRHTVVTISLKATQENAKQRHEKQRTFMSFQLGDQVWLHLDKKHFKGHHHKLLPRRYGPYTILDKIGENDYRLDLPQQLGIHNVINVNHLNFFEPPLLEEPVTITDPMDNILDFQLPLAKDTLLDTQNRSTRHQTYTSYLVAHQGQTLAQAKWITIEVLHNKFPHLFMETRTLPDLNREELSQGGHLGERPLGAHKSTT
jgi:hypothetical protein